jgi:glycosyltransferase involved in cell wall biosynthesis
MIAPLNKIRLLCCIHDFRGRGAEKVLATLLDKMDREKYHLGVFVFHDTFALDLPKDVEMLSAHIPAYPPTAPAVTKIMGNARKVLALRGALGRYAPDVVLSVSGTNITLIAAACLFRRRMKIILSEHTMPSIFTNENRQRIIRLLTNKSISLMYPRADEIVVPSKGVSDDLFLNYGIPPEKITVIANPLDIEQIRHAADADLDFTFPEDGYYKIGFVGGLSREKNVGYLLKAFALLRERGKPVRLFLVGDGHERNDLERLAGRLSIADAVHFLGYQKNPYAFLKKFDMLVIPSFYETFSYVMFEAMACSVPVISTRWRGSEDLYKDRENCLLVPLDDPEAMAAAISELMAGEDLKRTLVAGGLELAQTCAVHKIIGRYDAMISRVVSGATGGGFGVKMKRGA